MGNMRQNAEDEKERKQCDHAFWHDEGWKYCPNCGANLGPVKKSKYNGLSNCEETRTSPN
jgi:hypothetical protein